LTALYQNVTKSIVIINQGKVVINMKKNILTLGCILALITFSFVGSASAATFNLNASSTIALGTGNVAVSGTCTGSTLSVPIVLTQNGAATQVGVATTPDNGPADTYTGFTNFALNIDDGFTTGPATLTAVCPEGNAVVGITLIDPDGILNVPMGTSLGFSGSTNLGTSFGINGVCGTTSASAGNNVTFTVTQNGTVSNLGSATTVNSNGNFSGNVAFGNGIVAGPAVITASCPGTGNVITTAITIADPTATGGTDTGTGTGTTPTNTPTETDRGGVSTTPQGGVAAGSGVGLNMLIAGVLMAAGIAGLAMRKRVLSLN
jgi:hypothetical protein